MRRREFITTLGGAAATAAWPLSAAMWPGTALGQTPAKTYRIGLLSPAAPVTDASPYGAPLIHALAQQGYAQGRNLVIERRGAEGQLDRLPRLLDELVTSNLDVIITVGYPPAQVAKQRTKLPVVVFAAGDPVTTGLVDSLAHPGGNITGISDVSAELTPKRMQLLKQMAPDLKRVAMLWNATDLGMTMRYRASELGAKAMDIGVLPLGVREPDDFGQAFATMDREKPDAILMVTDSLTALNRKRVFEYAAAHRLPAIFEFDWIVRDGGLMSYAPDLDETFVRVAFLADRLLKGAKPGDLPFEQPTRFKLVINMKTAKTLDLEVPAALLATADEVIE
jgi:putative tryptophan/tyrosine transport system substrate-binding protein